ncbi:MAG: BMC domain-containing protein [Clostridia bacterium]|nr:BMC domain-containing protein [Clostridia bacterium]
MKKKAVGCLEVLGYSVALDAMDKALKAADIKILGIDCNNPKSGDRAVIPNVFQVKFTGDVDHVKTALDVAKQTARSYLSEEDVLTHIIPGMAEGLESLLTIGKVKKRWR